MLPGLVLDTTGPDNLSVRETAETADRRTASAAVTLREKEFVLGMLRSSTTWGGRENRVESSAGPNQPRRGFVSVKPGCLKNFAVQWPATARLSVKAAGNTGSSQHVGREVNSSRDGFFTRRKPNGPLLISMAEPILERRTPRRRTLKGGRIVFNNRRSVIDCTVRNLSTGGALLSVPNVSGVPDQLDLPGEGLPFCASDLEVE